MGAGGYWEWKTPFQMKESGFVFLRRTFSLSEPGLLIASRYMEDPHKGCVNPFISWSTENWSLLQNRKIWVPLPGHQDNNILGWSLQTVEFTIPELMAKCQALLGCQNSWMKGTVFVFRTFPWCHAGWSLDPAQHRSRWVLCWHFHSLTLDLRLWTAVFLPCRMG